MDTRHRSKRMAGRANGCRSKRAGGLRSNRGGLAEWRRGYGMRTSDDGKAATQR